MIRVRRANDDDVRWLVDQLRDFNKFFASKKSLFSDDDFVVKGVLTLIDKHVVMIADDDVRGRMGFIAGYMTPHIMNPAITVLAEAFWWVPEEYRRTQAGIRLLHAFIAHGKAHADWITFGLEAKSPVNPKTLTKRGFRHQETNYLMEV